MRLAYIDLGKPDESAQSAFGAKSQSRAVEFGSSFRGFQRLRTEYERHDPANAGLRKQRGVSDKKLLDALSVCASVLKIGLKNDNSIRKSRCVERDSSRNAEEVIRPPERVARLSDVHRNLPFCLSKA
jgi:hypothetical protein